MTVWAPPVTIPTSDGLRSGATQNPPLPLRNPRNYWPVEARPKGFEPLTS